MRGWRRFWVGLSWPAGLVVCGFIALVILAPDDPRPHFPGQAKPVLQGADNPAQSAAPASASKLGPRPPASCVAPGFEEAARINTAGLTTLAWTPFRRPEIGWETYAPRIAQETGTLCAPTSSGFADALARWQSAHGLPANGRMDAASFGLMNTGWERARPFVRVSETGVCPDAPSDTGLAWADPSEGYDRKPIQLRPAALAAYRRMVAAARASSPAIAADRRLLSIFSGYRSPQADAARCVRDNDCGNVTRALCSAHRTGLAMDVYLGAAPGQSPESSDDTNRLYQSKSGAYAWLVANAARYGFVNYPFEPWHWEWVGEAQ